jgi:hypothetical protein
VLLKVILTIIYLARSGREAKLLQIDRDKRGSQSHESVQTFTIARQRFHRKPSVFHAESREKKPNLVITHRLAPGGLAASVLPTLLVCPCSCLASGMDTTSVLLASPHP